MIRTVSQLIFFFIVTASCYAQNSKKASVFIDCPQSCNVEYFQQEIDFVNFAIDANIADVHILITHETTGDGGKMYQLIFLSKNKYKNTLYLETRPDASSDEVRLGLSKLIKIGIIGSLSNLPNFEKIDISVSLPKKDEPVIEHKDKWNHWVFMISGAGTGYKESSLEMYNISEIFRASRVTEKNKISFTFDHRSRNVKYIIEDNIIESGTNATRVLASFIQSIGKQWSSRFTLGFGKSSFDNYRQKYDSDLGIEYSFFPYTEVHNRSLRFQTSLLLSHVNYIDVTLYDKTSEKTAQANNKILMKFQQPWGDLNTFIKASHFLHDTKKYNLTLGGEMSWRVTKGLTVDISGNVARVRDQINLPSKGLTPEEILLEKQVLATNYRLDFNVGFTYRFGALRNSIVNPRWTQ